MSSASEAACRNYENDHVHKVYSAISSHFSRTRHKPWPVVEKFLLAQPAGAVGLDIGAGNGKYLEVNPDIYIIASDRSEELAKIAALHEWSAVSVADSLSLPHPNARFDFAISIAVIHHLSTSSRRIGAVRSILETLRQGQLSFRSGRALIFVWALEQKSSRRGWDEGDEQDVMVPWVLKESGSTSEGKTLFRYYHLYRKGELEGDILRAGGKILESGYDRDNWWAIATRQ